MQEDLLTVIVPVYNVADYLEHCLESILSQTYRNTQVVIVNDGSTDDSGRICREYASKDERILLIEQENQGLACARNAGLDYALGTYIAFIDSDDYIEPEFLERLHEAAQREDAEVSCCSYSVVDEDGSLIREAHFKEELTDEHGYWKTALIAETLNSYVWNKLYRRSAIGSLRYIPGKLCQDHAFNLKFFSQASRVYFLDEPLYHYRHRPKSICTSPGYVMNLDAIEFDIDTYNHLESRGFYDCTPHSFHRAIAHLARKSPDSDDPAEQERYRGYQAAIDEEYRHEVQRGMLPFSLRLRYRLLRLLGSRGYLFISGVFRAVKRD